MTNPNITNVLNAKSLEKQIKIYEARLQVLQAEMEELTQLKSACQLLLGVVAPEVAPVAESVEAKNTKAKTKKESKSEESEAPEGEMQASDFDADHSTSLDN